MILKTITTKVKNGKVTENGIEKDYYIENERVVLFDKEGRIFIVVDDDFCHVVYDKAYGASIGQVQYMGSCVVPDMPQDVFFNNLVEKDIDFAEWGHYFGIKDRIYSNYQRLKKSCKENNIDCSWFPKWETKHERRARGEV